MWHFRLSEVEQLLSVVPQLPLDDVVVVDQIDLVIVDEPPPPRPIALRLRPHQGDVVVRFSPKEHDSYEEVRGELISSRMWLALELQFSRQGPPHIDELGIGRDVV